MFAKKNNQNSLPVYFKMFHVKHQVIHEIHVSRGTFNTGRL